MKEIEVKGQKRTDLGKKAAKAMRKENLIPCNLYGEAKNADGAPEAMSIACPMSELRKIVYTPRRGAHSNSEGTAVPPCN